MSFTFFDLFFISFLSQVPYLIFFKQYQTMSEIKFNGSTFDDVTLEVSQIFMNEVVETKKYKASKAILALKSETFRTMLSNPLGNPNNGDFFPIKVTSSLENFEHFCR